MREIKEILLEAVNSWYESTIGMAEYEDHKRATGWLEEAFRDDEPDTPLTEFEKKLNGEMYLEYLDTGEMVNRKYYVTVDDDIELRETECGSVHVFNGDYGKYILELVK